MRYPRSKVTLSRFAELPRNSAGTLAVQLALCAVLLARAFGAQPSAGWRIDTFAGLPDIRDRGLAIDARLARISSRGTELERMVAQIREVWPGVKIMLRGDSVFCRDELLSWCEENQVDYVLGSARN